MSCKKENKFKVGDKVRVVRNVSGHNLNVPCVATVTMVNITANPNGYNLQVREQPSFWLHDSEVEPLPVTKEEFHKELQGLLAEVESLREKLAWMDEVGATEFCCQEYRVYKALGVLKSDSATDAQKAKKLVELLKDL